MEFYAKFDRERAILLAPYSLAAAGSLMRHHQFTKTYRTRYGRSSFQMAAALLLSTASVLSLPCTAVADDTAEDLRQLRAAIQKELGDLKKREQKLRQEFLRLDQKSQLLDQQLRKLRAAGAGPGGANPSAAAGGVAPPAGAEGSPKPPGATEVAQTPAPATAAQPAPEGGAAASAAPPAGGETGSRVRPSNPRKRANRRCRWRAYHAWRARSRVRRARVPSTAYLPRA